MLTDDHLFALHRKAWEIEGDNAANARERYGRLVEAEARREAFREAADLIENSAGVNSLPYAEMLREKADE